MNPGERRRHERLKAQPGRTLHGPFAASGWLLECKQPAGLDIGQKSNQGKATVNEQDPDRLEFDV